MACKSQRRTYKSFSERESIPDSKINGELQTLRCYKTFIYNMDYTKEKEEIKELIDSYVQDNRGCEALIDANDEKIARLEKTLKGYEELEKGGNK